jgi:hypothetical protein
MTVAHLHSFLEEDSVTGKPRNFGSTLRGVKAAAKKANVTPVIIGAGALATYGSPRYTKDIDVLLPHADARRLIMALIDAGYKGPPPSRDVPLYVMESPSKTEVDVMAASEDLYMDVIESKKPAIFLGESVYVPSPEFYVLMKLDAASDIKGERLKHLSDIEALGRTKTEVDMVFVKNYVMSKQPELLPMWEKLIGFLEDK